MESLSLLWKYLRKFQSLNHSWGSVIRIEDAKVQNFRKTAHFRNMLQQNQNVNVYLWTLFWMIKTPYVKSQERPNAINKFWMNLFQTVSHQGKQNTIIVSNRSQRGLTCLSVCLCQSSQGGYRESLTLREKRERAGGRAQDREFGKTEEEPWAMGSDVSVHALVWL